MSNVHNGFPDSKSSTHTFPSLPVVYAICLPLLVISVTILERIVCVLSNSPLDRYTLMSPFLLLPTTILPPGEVVILAPEMGSVCSYWPAAENTFTCPLSITRNLSSDVTATLRGLATFPFGYQMSHLDKTVVRIPRCYRGKRELLLIHNRQLRVNQAGLQRHL